MTKMIEVKNLKFFFLKKVEKKITQKKVKKKKMAELTWRRKKVAKIKKR